MLGRVETGASLSLNVVGNWGTEYRVSVLSFSPVANAIFARSRVMSPPLVCGLPSTMSLNQLWTRLPESPSLSVSRITSAFGMCVGSLSIVVSSSTHTGLRQPVCLPRAGSSQPVWRSAHE